MRPFPLRIVPRLGRAALPAAATLLAVALLAATAAQGQFWSSSRPMPEFPNKSAALWINTKPLSKADLQGKVVLIEIWTSI